MKEQTNKQVETRKGHSLFIELSNKNVRKVKSAAKKLNRSESFIIDSLLKGIEIKTNIC